MIQEDKDLLLKDLSARLPYGVIVYDYDREETREMGLGTLHDIMFNDLECKPYLRPMSSMTEEESETYEQLLKDMHYKPRSSTATKYIDWLNANQFDYRGLIEKDLAIKASEGMYN